MVRSNLTTKFHKGAVAKYEKSFKENYKKEEGEVFKGNVIHHITLGVIQKKSIPEVGDIITLIKLGNTNCDDKQAEEILDRWLENEENKKRGLVGAFCDLCKDICIDIPIHEVITQQIINLEETINKSLREKEEISNKFKDLISQLQSIKNLNVDKDKLGVKENNTQE